MFLESTITHVDIPSGSGVKLEDSASDDIRAFIESRFYTMGVEPTWITKALDYLVPRTDGIFIWATVATAAEFLQINLQERFSMVQSKGDGKGLKSLYSLYSAVVKTSFRRHLEDEEIEMVTSVMGAMIFAKEPLNDDALIMLPGVKSRNMLQFKVVLFPSSTQAPSFTSITAHLRTWSSLPPFYRTSLNFQLSKIETVMNVNSPCYV